MSKQIIIDHEHISDPQEITRRVSEEMESRGLNIHVNEVEKVEDDFKRGKRILEVKNTKYFFT